MIPSETDRSRSLLDDLCGGSLSPDDLLMMDEARLAARASHDSDKQVGAVVVSACGRRMLGANRLPRGLRCDVPERHLKPHKDDYMEHAERDVLFAAARAGFPLAGATMYLNWWPCGPCARAIVAFGLSRVVGARPDFGQAKYGTSFRNSLEILREGGVALGFADVPPP